MGVLRDYNYWINKIIVEYQTSQKKYHSLIDEIEDIAKRKKQYKNVYESLLLQTDRKSIDIENTALFSKMNMRIEELKKEAEDCLNYKSSEGYYTKDIADSILNQDDKLEQMAKLEDNYVAKFYYACNMLAKSKTSTEKEKGPRLLLELSNNEKAGKVAENAKNVYWIYHISVQLDNINQALQELLSQSYAANKDSKFYKKIEKEAEDLKKRALGILDETNHMAELDLDEDVVPELINLVNQSICECNQEIDRVRRQHDVIKRDGKNRFLNRIRVDIELNGSIVLSVVYLLLVCAFIMLGGGNLIDSKGDSIQKLFSIPINVYATSITTEKDYNPLLIYFGKHLDYLSMSSSDYSQLIMPFAQIDRYELTYSKEKYITVPDGYGIVDAYVGYNSALAVNFPEGLKKAKLSYCKNISTDVKMPEGIEEIEIDNCVIYGNVNFPEGLKKVSISQWNNEYDLSFPKGIEEVQISYCENMKDLNFPEGVKRIQISGCPNITDLNIPNGVEEIQISDCENLPQLSIPEGVNTVDIRECRLLTQLSLPDNFGWIEIRECKVNLDDFISDSRFDVRENKNNPKDLFWFITRKK